MNTRKYESLKKARKQKQRVFQFVETTNLVFYTTLFITAGIRISLEVSDIIDRYLNSVSNLAKLLIIGIFVALLFGFVFCCISFCSKVSKEVNMGVLLRSKFWWLVPLLGVCKVVVSFVIVILYL